MFLAAARGDVGAMRAFLEGGASSSRVVLGSQAIHVAAHAGHVGVVRVLLEVNAANHSPLNVYGNTPLYLAAMMGHADVVEALVDAGADVNGPRFTSSDSATVLLQETPLHVAARLGHAHVLDILLGATRFPRGHFPRGLDVSLPCIASVVQRHERAHLLIHAVRSGAEASSSGDSTLRRFSRLPEEVKWMVVQRVLQ